jgi:epoxyqueuosine reductase
MAKLPFVRGNAGTPADWPGFPVAVQRFDQRNEIFKRGCWDPEIIPLAEEFHDIRYRDKPGYGKLDYAFQMAPWNMEDTFGYDRAGDGRPALYSWDRFCADFDLPEGPVREAPDRMSYVVKKAARFFGADLVGITRVHPSWVYSHSFNKATGGHQKLELPRGCRNAIVLALAMDFEGMASSPAGPAGGATAVGYARMAFTANLVATFIHHLGYQAVPCGNDTGLSVPLALAAGLGEWSRMGLLITERFGPRVRLCKVFTDLPLETDSYTPFGAVEFCRTCKTCAEHCSSQAIPYDEPTTRGPSAISNQHGPCKWYVDGAKCYGFWAKNRMDCSVCIRVCPFNKTEGPLHDAVRGVIRSTTAFNDLIVRVDRALGYDKPRPARLFWE